MNPKQFGEDIEFSTAWIHIFADNVEADFPAAADRQAKRMQFSIVQIGLNAIDGEPAETKPTEDSINPSVYGSDRQKHAAPDSGVGALRRQQLHLRWLPPSAESGRCETKAAEASGEGDPGGRPPTSGSLGSVSRNTRERSVPRHKDAHCALKILTPQIERSLVGVWDEHRGIAAQIQREMQKAILFRRVEQIVAKQPWYQGRYRANIVAYTVSTLSQLISTEAPSRSLDFRSIWNRQGLMPALEAQLIRIAASVFEVIVNPQAGLQNVTEWCKKELCWKRTADLEMNLSAALFKELIDRDEEFQQKKDSIVDQKIEVGIERQTLVLQFGADYCKALREWGARQGLLSPDDIGILAVATTMPRKLPTEKQSWRLLEVKGRLEAEGYPVQLVNADMS